MVNESLTPRIDLRSYLRGEWAGNGCVGDCSSVRQRIGPILGRGRGGFHNPTAVRISNRDARGRKPFPGESVHGVRAMEECDRGSEPDQSFSSMAQIPSAMISGIAKLLLSGAALIAYVLGFMLTVSLSIDLMSKAIYFVDGVVGKAAFGAFGLGGGSSDLVWTILMFAGALFLCKYVPARLKGESTRLAWKDLGTVVVILSLFIGMAFQSTKNHYDPPSIPGSGTAPVANPRPLRQS